jgi:hypothetical protein
MGPLAPGPSPPVHPPTRFQRAVHLAPEPGIVLTGTTTTMNPVLQPGLIGDSIGLILPEEALAVGLSFTPWLKGAG